MKRTKTHLIAYKDTPIRLLLVKHVLKYYPYFRKGIEHATINFLLSHVDSPKLRDKFRKAIRLEKTNYLKNLTNERKRTTPIKTKN